jgi:protein-tyrosine kinase
MKNFQDLTVRDYLRILRRRIWYLIVPTILVSSGTAFYVQRLPAYYKSETTILVSDRLLPEDHIGSIVRQTVADRIEFAKQQLRSRTFLERIGQEFQLAGGNANADQLFNAVLNNSDVSVVPPNAIKVGFFSSDPAVAQAVTRRLSERVMQSNETFRQQKVSVADQFLEDELRQATDALALAEQRLRDFNQRHFPGVPEAINAETFTAMQTQLATVDTDLQNALGQRKAYERTLAEHRDLKLTAQSLQAPAAKPTPTPATQPVVAVVSPEEKRLAERKAELSALLSRYTPEHPDVNRVSREVRELEAQVAKVTPASEPVPEPTPTIKTETKQLPEIDLSVDFYEAEIRRELELLNREIAKKEASRKDIATKARTYAMRMNMPAAITNELASLTQDRETTKQRYTYLATRKLNSDLAGKVDTNANNRTFTTIDPPNLPQTPEGPDRWTLRTIGCLAGLMLGFGLVFAREVLNSTLSDEEAAASELKLPVLTAIPVLDGSGRRHAAVKRKRQAVAKREKQQALIHILPQEERDPVREFSLQSADDQVRDVILSPSTIAGEQYRIMRAQLASKNHNGIKTLLVTSAVPDEGKTFVACCLAGILAKQQGKRVLLVDGDLRTANTGHIMGVQNDGPLSGLSDVLAGRADVEDCILPCSELSLSLLPAGNAIGNPAELLNSPHLEHIVHDLTLLFDWIIIDSPPVLPIADAKVLLPVCDAAIIVVRANRTPVELVKESINKVGRERVSGIVMNYVKDIKATHYYGRYYNRIVQPQK